MNKNTIIYSSIGDATLSAKVYAIFIIFALLILLPGCDSNKIANEEDSDSDLPVSNVTMTLRSGTNSVFLNNALMYVFRDNDQFVEKKLNVKINTDENKLTTYMTVGTWNLVLLTCNTKISGDVILPPYGGNSSNPMWKTKYTGQTDDFLSQSPAELRYASLPNTVILKNDITNTQATLNRNVAKIQVVLEDYSGFDPIVPGRNNFAFVDLLNVPTTLNWAGGYYPDRDNPNHSGNKPIREYFNFDTDLKADTVNFIVPAHRGTDAFEAQHNDTTKHKLRLQVSMPLKSESYFGKTKTPIEISYVPKINRIVRVILNFRGEPDTDLGVKVTVKEWEDPIDQDVTFE